MKEDMIGKRHKSSNTENHTNHTKYGGFVKILNIQRNYTNYTSDQNSFNNTYEGCLAFISRRFCSKSGTDTSILFMDVFF